MPLIALNKKTNERVDISEFDEPAFQLRANDLACPLCESRMMVVSAVKDTGGYTKRIAHFRHHRINDCIYTAYGAGESEQHRQAKLWLREQLLKESGFRVPVELEYHIAEVSRIADVAQIFPTGWIVVHEIQLATITVQNLDARSRDYLVAGCDVIWYLGGKARTEANLIWAEAFQGFRAIIHFEENRDESDRFEQDNGAEGGVPAIVARNNGQDHRHN